MRKMWNAKEDLKESIWWQRTSLSLNAKTHLSRIEFLVNAIVPAHLRYVINAEYAAVKSANNSCYADKSLRFDFQFNPL